MAIQDLSRGSTCMSWSVSNLQEISSKVLWIDVARGGYFQDLVFHRFYSCLSVASIPKCPEFRTSELGSAIGPEAERNTNFPEQADGVGSGCVSMTGENHRPARESVSNDKEGLPSNYEEICRY